MAHIEAKNLLQNLELARNHYKDKIYNEGLNSAAESAFKKQCRAIILIVKPILEKDLGWGDYLQNLLKLFEDKMLIVAGRDNHSFFKLAESVSVQAVKRVELDLLLEEASSLSLH